MKTALSVLLLASCVVGDDGNGGVDTDGDDGTVTADVAGSPTQLNIGFDGEADQFGYFSDFFTASVAQPGPRLCHGYFAWDVAEQAPHSGDPTFEGSRAFLDNWLAAAQGHCDDALIAFKAEANRAAPSEAEFTAAFTKFAAVDWKTETGFTGTFSISTWNEPNNSAGAGNGLGVQIEAGLAARYYLVAEKLSRTRGWKVAAGDFASNGDTWNDFEFNCENDNVATADLCNEKSSVSLGGASYLDRYKNEIANHANDYGLGAHFRPTYFAYHGWHDTNGYLDNDDQCTGYGTCAIRRILKSLGGSWGATILWDTEDGIGQNVPITDAAQACGAAFLLRKSVLSRRITRLYITRLHGGGGELVDGTTPRPAMTVLAQRDTTRSGCD